MQSGLAVADEQHDTVAYLQYSGGANVSISNAGFVVISALDAAARQMEASYCCRAACAGWPICVALR